MSDVEIGVVDYGLGNIRSVTRGLERAGAEVALLDEPRSISQVDGVVLPGVGAFKEGVENAGPFRQALLEVAESETPLFGICLGMQMLLSTSEEADRAGQGEVEGLSLIPGRNVRFSADLTVPHMGWNRITVERSHPVFDPLDDEYVYFVHSYYAAPDSPDAVIASTEYGSRFPAVIANDRGTVFGTQFHPEKSGRVGLTVLERFVAFCEASA